MMNKKFFCFIMIAAMVLALSACGKMADPEPYEGSGYPHSYPRS